MNSPHTPLTFSKAARVRSRLDFDAIYDRGVRQSDGCLSILLLPNDRATSRLGLAVSKRCGNAVQRNRFKRRLREVFRLSRANLPTGFDLVVQPRANTPLDVDLLTKSLVSLMRRAVKKLLARSSTSPSAKNPLDESAAGSES